MMTALNEALRDLNCIDTDHDAPIELLQVADDLDQWTIFDPKPYTRRLNALLKTPTVREAYDRSMRAAEAVTRWDLYRLYKRKKLPSLMPLLDGEQYLWPAQCECGDWSCFMPPGRPPLYRRFVCTRLCHWLSDANRLVASLLFPDLNWGVVSSDKHTSAVCPEERLLFDLNFHTLGVRAKTSLQMMFGDAFKNPDWIWYPEDTYDCTTSEMTSQALRFWHLCDSHEGDKQELVADLERLLDDETVSTTTAADIAWECSGLLEDALEPVEACPA